MNVRVITPLLSATLVMILGLQACAVNPATGQPNLVLMSESRELEIGEEEHEKVLASMRVVCLLYTSPSPRD